MHCKYLSENERYVISHLAISGYCIKTIAGRINRNSTTFGRELGQLDGAILEDTIYFQENGRKWRQRWFHNNLIKFIWKQVALGPVSSFLRTMIQFDNEFEKRY